MIYVMDNNEKGKYKLLWVQPEVAGYALDATGYSGSNR